MNIIEDRACVNRSGVCYIMARDRNQGPEDFAQRKVLIDEGPAIVWVRLPNTRKRDLLAWFETVLPDVLAALERGETLVEVASL